MQIIGAIFVGFITVTIAYLALQLLIVIIPIFFFLGLFTIAVLMAYAVIKHWDEFKNL